MCHGLRCEVVSPARARRRVLGGVEPGKGPAQGRIRNLGRQEGRLRRLMGVPLLIREEEWLPVWRSLFTA